MCRLTDSQIKQINCLRQLTCDGGSCALAVVIIGHYNHSSYLLLVVLLESLFTDVFTALLRATCPSDCIVSLTCQGIINMQPHRHLLTLCQ